LKNAAAGLAHGGGKSVLYGDPKDSSDLKEARIRAMASALADCRDYIFGPDMGTDERCMAWVKDEIGRAVGLPRELGGIPLDELGATGWGVVHACEVAGERVNVKLDGARVVVQGFGAVGLHAARFLVARNAVVVAVSDSRGAAKDPAGLDLERLIALKRAGRSVGDYAADREIDPDGLLDVECEFWIPAARPDVITEDNVDRLRAKVVVAGANIPTSDAAERTLHERGILNVPDFIANAGGVICAAMEYRGATQQAVFDEIEERVRSNTALVLEDAAQRGITPREAATDFATARVKAAMASRRWSIF
jgi:glutamate dehydrogenase (NAD(P)+)